MYTLEQELLIISKSKFILLRKLQKTLKMDIEFIEEEHRDSVMKLIEVCGLEIEGAYQLLQSCDYNFEAAVQKNFNGGESSLKEKNNAFHPPYEQQYDQEDAYEKYKRFVAEKTFFEDKYPKREKEGIIKKFVSSFWKSDEDSIKAQLLSSGKIGNVKTIFYKFQTGNLSEALHLCWKEKFPFILFNFSFEDGQIQKNEKGQTITEWKHVEKILADEHFADICNTQFKLYSLNAKNYDLQPSLQKLFNLKRDGNSLIFCRVDILDEIKVIKRVKFTKSMDEIRKILKQIKSQCIQDELEEMHYEKQFQAELNGTEYRKPRTIKQSIKIREDRKIRDLQEKQFYNSVAANKPPGVQTQTNQNGSKANGGETKIESKKPVKQQQQSKEQIQKKRATTREGLQMYDSGMTIKLRLPTGQGTIIRVNPKQKVKYLFDFIFTDPKEDIFENDLKREFDIIRPYDKLSLKNRQEETLAVVFEDSDMENLVVNQLNE